MKELRRIEVGNFNIKDTIKIEDIKNNENLLEENVISIEEFFKDREKIELTDKELELFLNGVKLNNKCSNGIYKIYSNNFFIGLGTIEKNKLKRDIIL